MIEVLISPKCSVPNLYRHSNGCEDHRGLMEGSKERLLPTTNASVIQKRTLDKVKMSRSLRRGPFSGAGQRTASCREGAGVLAIIQTALAIHLLTESFHRKQVEAGRFMGRP
jgi:hypothetical protein